MDNQFECGGWIQTYTGQQFYPLDPKLDTIKIMDICHGLSMMNRFNGHTVFPYSVGQHSLLMSNILMYYGRSDDMIQKAALLHDASEAYISDLTRPVKNRIPGYREIEARLQKAIYDKYEVSLTPEDEDFLTRADNTMLVLERDQILNTPTIAWAAPPTLNLQPIGGGEYPWGKIKQTQWGRVKEILLDRFYSLGIKSGD